MDGGFVLLMISFLGIMGVLSVQQQCTDTELKMKREEYCQQISKTAGEFERCLRVKE